MSLLGFGAIGVDPIGIGPRDDVKNSPRENTWTNPAKKVGLSAAILATVGSGFVPQPPQVQVVQPTPVFTNFSQPTPTVGVRTHLQPQLVIGIGLVSLAVTPGPLVFPLFTQPAFGPVKQAVHAALPRYEVGFTGPAVTSGPLVFTKFSQPPPVVGVRTHLQPQPAYQVGYGGPANTPGPLVFSKFEGVPRAPTKVAAHLQPQVNYQVGYSGPASTSGPLVFSTYSQPRFFDFPTNLQPQPANRTYFYTFYDDAEVIQVLQELRVSYSDPRDFFSDVEIATVPEETRIASLFQEDRVLVVEPRKVVETDAEFRLDGLPNRLRTK